MSVNNINYRKRAVVAVTSGLIILMLAIGLHTSTYLTIREYSVVGNNQGLMIPVRLNDSFFIEYTHSVFKTQVREVFRITKTELIMLEETTYESVGIGLPSNTPYEFSFSDGLFKISGINQAMDNIMLRVGRIADHNLLVNDQRIGLKAYFPPETLIEIKVEEGYVYQYWLREKNHD